MLPSGLVTILAFIFMLGILVLVHELGHFLTAIKLGIKVDEFGLGFPPRAKTLFERNGVKYTLNWLPIGGFVRFGNDNAADSIYGVGSLSAAEPWKKITVLFAGPLMNLLLAILIFSGIFLYQGVPQTLPGAQLTDVYANTPAARAGLQKDDIILMVAGEDIGTDISRISALARSNTGVSIPVIVDRNGQQISLSVIPGPWEHEGKQFPSGFGFGYLPNTITVPANILSALTTGTSYTFMILGRFIEGFSMMIASLFGLSEPLPGGVTGVVGMARGTGEVIENGGLIGFLRWSALISLNLFLINLLPIPALDGSHIMFSLIEIVRRGKKIPPEREAMVHAVGFVMLLGLMVLITISDVANWIQGTPVLGGG